MTVIAPIFELSVVGVFDSGVPHRERIVMRPTQAVDLGQFGLILGVAVDNQTTPLNDFFRWLGPKVIAPPSWLVVYTDSGSDVETIHSETGEPVFITHWGRPNTLFNDGPFQIVVGVIKIGGLISWLVPKPVAPMTGLLAPAPPSAQADTHRL